MRISRIFSLIILLLAGAVVALMILDAGSVAYKIMWGMALVCVILMVVFYRNVMRPLRVIANGVDLLQAQDFSSRLAHVGQREADRIVDLFNGMMSSLKRERLRLREQDHFLDLLIDVSPMGIIMLDYDGRMTGGNRAAAGFLGMKSADEICGKLPAESGTGLGAIIEELAPKEVKVVRLQDSMVYRCSKLAFMESGMSHPFILIERLTDEVMKVERKSYEKVIRMMAHEVNNSLAGMLSTVSTAAEEVADPDLAEALTACERRCRDMGAFITKFASAVKIPAPVKAVADLSSLITEWLPMLESTCSAYGAELQISIPEKETFVMLDPVLIEQTITNIVKNAAESCGEGGHVKIELGKPGVTLTISDDGPGISREAAGMLFTPFFTTKASGHGLGLLLVNEVLNSHGCKFSLATDADGITRFRIKF